MPLKPFAPNNGAEKKIFLLKPRGFCAGVVRAIDVVKIALDLYGPPVYVRKEIVHNKHVVEEFREAGAIFVEEVEEVPSGARAIFSAHGVSPAVRRDAKQRNLEVIDATCPLVTKVHLEAVRFARDGYSIVLIGHKDHDEVIGTLGEVPDRTFLVETVEDVDKLDVPDPERVCYLTQTTLSLDETRDIMVRLKERFPADPGTARAGHLLCHRKPADGGEGRRHELRSAAGGRLQQQLEFQAPGGGGREYRRAILPGERSHRNRCGLAGRRAECSGDRGRFGPGTPGERVDRIPERERLPFARGDRTGG